MVRQISRFLSLILCVLALILSQSGCSQPTSSTSTGLPPIVFIAAPGQSGLAKYVSWASIMEAKTGLSIRVIPEASPIQQTLDIKSGKMLLGPGSKSAYRNVIEALEDNATRNGGPYQVRIVWVHDLASSGVFVRGDSPIKAVSDIKPGVRLAVWDMKPSTLHPSESLLAWANVNPKEAVWVNAGSYDGAMRAVAEGRADLAFCFPVSPAVYEAASAPQGIRFIDLNSDKDPEGTKRWQAVNPLYSFAPIAAGVPEAIGHWGSAGYIYDVTSAEADPELVYFFAKWLDNNYDLYKDKYDSNKFMTLNHLMESLKTGYMPVHPGLIKYLKEKGLWTEAHDRRQQVNIDMLTTYIKAYADAIKLADQKGIKIDPGNGQWLGLWEDYKIEHRIPIVSMHTSLTKDATHVMPTKGAALSTDTSATSPTPTVAPPTTPASKPTSTPPPTQTQAAGLKLQIVSVNNPVKVDGDAKITAKTEPGAQCKITVWLSDGRVSGFPKDIEKTADANGNVEWLWQVTRMTLGGETKLEVTATLGGKTATAGSVFTIIK